MATVPTPRSGSQILGDLIDGVLSRLGLTDLKPGSPALSFLESIAQSDLRGSQAIFEMLASSALDSAEGQALDRIGADLKAPRDPARASSGYTTWSDTSFSKISSRLYSGVAAPIVGSDRIYVEDATDFPASGSIYLSRGTQRYEGPIQYSSKTLLGSYWRLDLVSSTQNFHLHGESVILAQGGIRSINAGTVCQAPLGGAQAAIGFSTVFGASIPDGETEITNVLVVAQRPGSVGKIPAGGIKTVSGTPFSGAAVTNPLPFSNGTDQENDDDYRERLREIVQTRSRGTPLALELGVRGVTSTDEQKRISSAVFVEGPSRGTLYIDDGTGYEERSEGVEFEVLQEEAVGGEEFFQVRAALPVTRAFIESGLTAPFALEAGATLAVRVGGVLYQHSFSAAEFRSIGSATTYEVVASINANSELGFQARTSDNGTRFSLFAKDATNEDLQLVEPLAPTVNANQWFAFTESRVETARLFLNDRLLSKDGERAEVFSAQQSSWLPVSGSKTLVLSVDSTPSQTYTFTDSDFINLNTGYTTLASTNSLESWAAVLMSKIPGVSVETGGGRLTLVSNLGRSSRAAITIAGGTLVTDMQMFTAVVGLSDVGRNRDYQMNRSTGQIFLEDPLQPGDRLTIGTTAPRAFIESSELGVVNLATDANLWFVIDGQVQSVASTLLPSQTIDLDLYNPTPDGTWGERVRITANSGTPFSEVQRGDWAIFMDTNLLSANRGAWRVAEVISGGLAFDIERASFSSAQSGVAMNGGGIVFARTRSLIQKVTVPAGATYTAATLSEALNTRLRGATSSVWNTTRLRVQTLNGDADGSVALVAQDNSALLMGLPVSIQENAARQMAVVRSGWSQESTPFSTILPLDSVTGQDVDVGATGLYMGAIWHWSYELPEPDGGGSRTRYGTNAHFMSTVSSRTGGVYTIREPFLQVPTTETGLFFSLPSSIGAEDTFTVMVDDEYRFAMNMFRRLKPTTSTFGTVNTFTDADNGNLSLAAAFGTGFNFDDFAVLMHARQKSHAEAGDTTKTILWRMKSFGAAGQASRILYSYPEAVSSDVTVTADAYVPSEGGVTHIRVGLASGAARSGYLIRPTTRIGQLITTPGALNRITYILGFAANSAVRVANVTTLDLFTAMTALGATDHGLQVGDRIWFNSTSGTYSSGLKIITARTATSISYAEVAAGDAGTPNPGRMSFDSAGEALFAGSTIIVGDIANFINAPFPDPVFRKALRVHGIGDQYLQVYNDEDLTGAPTTVGWTAISNVANFSAYPLDATKNVASAIATTVNGLGAGCPVTAVAVGLAGVATGVVDLASFEEFNTINYGYRPRESFNFIRSHTTPPDTATNVTFTFKYAVTSALATNSDWANEDVRLVPSSSVNIRDFLNCLGVSGLASVAETTVLDKDRSLQITSLRVGSGGKTQVQGGTANAAATSVLSATTEVDDVKTFMVATSGIDGITFGYADLVNSQVMPRPSVITSATTLVSCDANGNCVLSGTPAWVAPTVGPNPKVGHNWQVEKFGNLVMWRWNGIGTTPDLSGLEEGNYVYIYGGTASTGNLGLHRIVRRASTSFWIENPDFIEETCSPNLLFLDGEQSMLPGDTLSIGTTAWGSGLQGTWEIESVDPANPFAFKLAGTFPVFTGPSNLGSDYPLVQVHEGEPSKCVALVLGITPNGDDPTFTDVKVQNFIDPYWISSAAGTVLRMRDKLAFPTSLEVGFDAYRHSLGLIAESAKIVFGDRASPVQFPGLAAANSVVEISGPIVRRVTLGFAVRLRTQFNANDVIESFRSAIAAEVNKNPIGASLAISALVAAGMRVPGVEAVTVTSPTYGLGTDLIEAQPQEKLLVLDLEDISVTLVGE